MAIQHSVASPHELRPASALPGRFLRQVLLANAGFSALSGLLLLVDAAPLATFSGLPALALRLTGVSLLLFAAEVAWLATRAQPDRRAVALIFGLDCAWVIASVIVLLAGLLPLTLGGKWAVGIIADVVAVFALLEFWGLRRLSAPEQS